VPLAFAFIASFGPVGMVTAGSPAAAWTSPASACTCFDLSGLSSSTSTSSPADGAGDLPALEGLRPQWQEAARNLGANQWQYWRLVGGPLLLPPYVGSLMLLFANSFAAYATAAALTTGSIRWYRSRSARSCPECGRGQENVGNALGLGAIVLVSLAVAGTR